MYIYTCIYRHIYVYMYIDIYIYIFKGFTPAASPFTCNNLQIYKDVTLKLQLLNVSDDVVLNVSDEISCEFLVLLSEKCAHSSQGVLYVLMHQL